MSHFTSEFGMGSGGSNSLWSSGKTFRALLPFCTAKEHNALLTIRLCDQYVSSSYICGLLIWLYPYNTALALYGQALTGN